jgi:hypothetical protein
MPMTRVVQQKATGLFLSAPHRWVARIEDATYWLSLSEAIQAIRAAEITDASCHIILLFYDGTLSTRRA